MDMISVITINRNNAPGLLRTMESVISQSFEGIQYIVIDGASTDHSVSVISKYADRLSYWVSEPDNGIYHAMNKGIAKAAGKYLLFLNSGDYLADNQVIRKIAEQSTGKDILYGSIAVYVGGKLKKLDAPRKIVYSERYQHNLPAHAATFIQKRLFDKYGLFDESYPIIADVVFFSRAFADRQTTYQHIDEVISVFDLNGVSSHKANQTAIYEERMRFIQKEFPRYQHALKQYYHPSFFKRLYDYCRHRL